MFFVVVFLILLLLYFISILFLKSKEYIPFQFYLKKCQKLGSKILQIFIRNGKLQKIVTYIIIVLILGGLFFFVEKSFEKSNTKNDESSSFDEGPALRDMPCFQNQTYYIYDESGECCKDKDNNTICDKNEQKEILITQTPEKQVEGYYLGEPVQVGSFEYTINSYYTTAAIGQNLMGTFMGETADGMFMVVDVTIENTGTQSVTLWDSMIKVVDDQGRTYNHDMNAEIYLSMSNKKAFTFEQLQPGLPKRGYLVFDVPADLKGSFEISSTNLFSSEKKYISFVERP